MLTPFERKLVAYHEVGHALISALQKNSEPVQKITIVPRTMGALGYVMHVPEEEKYLNTEAELRDMLVGLVGGRAAEEVVFDTVTTGAANDIERATEIARSMVTRYGMSKKFGLVGLATIESQYLEGRAALNCSDETAAAIDEEVVAIIKESYDKALELLRENRELMDKLAAFRKFFIHSAACLRVCRGIFPHGRRVALIIIGKILIYAVEYIVNLAHKFILPEF